MKILKIENVNDKIYISTDNISRPIFAYKANRFKNLKDIEMEINKSIDSENKRKSVKEAKLTVINDDFQKVK